MPLVTDRTILAASLLLTKWCLKSISVLITVHTHTHTHKCIQSTLLCVVLDIIKSNLTILKQQKTTGHNDILSHQWIYQCFIIKSRLKLWKLKQLIWYDLHMCLEEYLFFLILYSPTKSPQISLRVNNRRCVMWFISLGFPA